MKEPKEKKEKKEKPAYSAWSNALYSVASLWHEEKSLIVLVFIGTVMRVALPFAGIVTPKIVIDEITLGASPGRFTAVMGIMAGVLVVIHFIKGYTDNVINDNIGFVGHKHFFMRSSEKLLTMDYEHCENAEFIKYREKATAQMSNHAPASNITRTLTAIAVNISGLILYGSLIVLVHPLILALLAMNVAVNWLLLRWHRKFDENRWKTLWMPNQKHNYVNGVFGNKGYAKDIRMYTMLDWLKERSDFHRNELRVSDTQLSFRGLVSGLGDGLMVLIRDGAAYAFLTYLLLEGRIGLGDFVMIFAAIGTLAGWISGAINEFNNLFSASVEMSFRRQMLDFPDTSNTGSGAPLPPKDKGLEIRLENVSYTYPNAEKPALKNINLTIKPGERIAVVGVNGAGKTTLVKLICGLYRPTTGRVLLAGRDIQEYNRDEYFSLITAVFQDIYLLAESITENVSQQPPERTDPNRAAQCLEKAGLTEKMKALSKGGDTLLAREVHDDAIDLSGGEKQKLALARALYKNAPVIILDEPTAALDPIAENDMYQQYAALTQGKTSVYISHRLASTRFCDRILLIDSQIIAEEGSHDALMKRGGEYAKMFSIQASYYAKEEKEDVYA